MKLPFERQWKASERFKQFSLRVNQDFYLLPERHSLVVDSLLSTILLVDWRNEQVLGNCEVMDDEQFALVLTLLEQWPSYVPYERLLRQLGILLQAQDIEDLERLRVSGRADESEEELAQDEQAGARLQPILQTLRDLLHDCKPYLHEFGIDIGAVMDYGPVLTRYVEAKATQVEGSTR
jgi:hypothetical protein